MSDEMTPTEADRVAARAAARAANRAAKEAAEAADLESRITTRREAVETLLDYRAGVVETHGPAMLAVARHAATCVVGVRPRELLREARVLTDSAALELRGRKDWARQAGKFLRDGADLKVGSYAIGVQGKRAKTVRCYAIGIVEDNGRRLVLDARTSAEVAGEQAAASFASAWEVLTREAARKEMEETGEEPED